MPTDPKDKDPKPARDDDPPHEAADDDAPPTKAEANAVAAEIAKLDADLGKHGLSVVGLLTKLAKDQTGVEL